MQDLYSILCQQQTESPFKRSEKANPAAFLLVPDGAGVGRCCYIIIHIARG